jgi:hypothetical protein
LKGDWIDRLLLAVFCLSPVIAYDKGRHTNLQTDAALETEKYLFLITQPKSIH